VKAAAEARRLTVAQPARLAGVTDLGDTDVAVAAYGRLVPAAKPPAKGFVNAFSLLPRWRGASPVVRQSRRRSRDRVTLMQMDEGLDTGPIITREDRDLPRGERGSRPLPRRPRRSVVTRSLLVAGGRARRRPGPGLATRPPRSPGTRRSCRPGCTPPLR
jgi:hypothetical protein